MTAASLLLFDSPSSPAVLPKPPTRAQICGIRTSLQGLTYQTAQFGSFPAWFYSGLDAADRASARATHLAAGDTHISISISAAYMEPNTLLPDALLPGKDFSYDLEAFRSLLFETIAGGLLIDLPLAGDGLSVNPDPQEGQYNDPVGKTYGFEWLMHNLGRIIVSLKGDGTPAKPDLTPYIIFRPGWDSCFYGWGVPGEVPDLQPTRVKQFGELFRRLLPNGYLAIEHTPGNIPCGEGGSDYAPGGLMQHFDTIMSEFASVNQDSCWQVVARMVEFYHRPPDQPAGDDPNSGNVPNPHWYLRPGNPRGPYFYVAFEPTRGGAYEWVRGWCSEADVQATRQYLKNLGCELTG